MKIMKYCLTVVLLIIVCMALTACKKQENNQMYHDLKKLTPYLYEISFDDYRPDTNLETLTNVEDFACSSVRNGNFYGRNFDFIFNDVPQFVVKVKAKEGRHASIGIANMASIHANNNIEDQYLEKLELLPNSTLDGINDCGVICSDNVVPREDVAPITGTNPNGEDLHASLIVRYVLDNASSADEAIELLKARNIYGNVGEHYNLHFMIADKNKTYVVEFIDNKLVAEEKTGNEQIMTNYYVNLDYLTENSAGVERYNILQQNYAEGNSFEGMWKLLQRVKYSNAYLGTKENAWYSEFLTQSVISKLDDEQVKNEALEGLANVKDGYLEARKNEQRNPANLSYWITTHNSTYDIAQRKLRVTVQENYDQYFEFTLND